MGTGRAVRARAALLALCALAAAAAAADRQTVGGGGGEIRGRVTDAATGAPLAGAEVELWNQGAVTGAVAGGDGRYQAAGLAPGSYNVVAHRRPDYVGELYDDVPCPGELFDACFPSAPGAVAIELGAGETVTGVDFRLDLGGRIGGRVTGADGAPVWLAQVRVWGPFPDDVPVLLATGPDGSYGLPGLIAGSYFVDADAAGHRAEMLDDVPCAGGLATCPERGGDELAIALGEHRAGIDLALDRQGGIAGRVTDAATGDPLPLVLVEAWVTEQAPAAGVRTAADGTFLLPLFPGAYYLTARSFDEHVHELHPGVHCPPSPPSGACGPLARGTPVTVVLDALAEVDFDLEVGGRIAGRVTAAPEDEPAEAELTAYDHRGERAAVGTAAGGAYEIGALSAGTYYLLTRSAETSDTRERLVDELYDDRLCPPPGTDVCDPRIGTPVEVVLGETTPDVDFALGRPGRITGRVRSAATGEPLAFARLELHDAAGRPIALASSQPPDGGFGFEVRRGTYYLWAEGRLHELADELYDGLPCAAGSCPSAEGTPIVVSQGQERTVELTLDEGGTIAGTVADLRAEPADASVELWSRHDRFAGATPVEADGGYRFEHLAADRYHVVVQPLGPGLPELYDGRICIGGAFPGCDPTEGTPIEVADGATTGGIDLAIRDPGAFDCVPTPTRVCLQDGRFQVAASWSASPLPDDPERRGRSQPLTADTGYAWFFRPDNVELLVKVLDACVPPFERFWVFAAGLTHLEVTLRVVDTWTGEVYFHRSQAGEAFPPLLDTLAFDTCDASAPERTPAPEAGAAPASAAPGAPRRRRWLDFAAPLAAVERLAASAAAERPAAPARTAAPGTAGGCTPGPERLCLQGGRFAVEAQWQTAGGESGGARAAPLTADTGTFWFFDPLNLELLVKVLDACGPPFDRYWVFAAGLTNVDVLVRVTDTATGEVWEHRNPQGAPFAPVLDAAAFDTCP